MNLMVRPSKTFLYDLLEKELSLASGEIGLDAASANFKNRKMFKTKYYYGLDYDLELLKQGLAKYQDPNTFGIQADMANLKGVADGSIDIVVSTNTLYQLPPDRRSRALSELIRICRPDGRFLCELILDPGFDTLLAIIKAHFSAIDVIYYRNPLSRIYEWIFERNGNLGSHPIAGMRLFRLLAWALSRIESLTCNIRSLNRRAFIKASEKTEKHSSIFNLSTPPGTRIITV